MKNFGATLKQARESKGLLARDLATRLAVDPALISRFESGKRIPTRKQVGAMAELLELDKDQLIIQWLGSRIYQEYREEPLAMQGLLAAEAEMRYYKSAVKTDVPTALKVLIKKAEKLKAELSRLRHLDSQKVAEALELEYTYESNRIEGNTLTLQETALVVAEGLTISGKSMREHLEAINHGDAIVFIKELVQKQFELNERTLLQLHSLVLRGIDRKNAGRYRTVQVRIGGSAHTPPEPYLVPKQMEDLMDWYETNKDSMHPLLLAAEMHERIVTIHPFIDGNGRTSRLVMNLILLSHGYVIANITGDKGNRLSYYQALENARQSTHRQPFLEFIANTEIQSLEKYLQTLAPSKF